MIDARSYSGQRFSCAAGGSIADDFVRVTGLLMRCMLFVSFAALPLALGLVHRLEPRLRYGLLT